MTHKACMPLYMNSGKIVAGRDGTGRVDIEGSTRSPRGPKKHKKLYHVICSSKRPYIKAVHCHSFFETCMLRQALQKDVSQQ